MSERVYFIIAIYSALISLCTYLYTNIVLIKYINGNANRCKNTSNFSTFFFFCLAGTNGGGGGKSDCEMIIE